MNYYQRTEKLLAHYKQLKVSVENKRRELAEMDYFAVSGIDFDYIGGGGGRGSKTEAAAVDIADRKERLEAEIRHTVSKLARVDAGLQTLGEIERTIIEKFYFERLQWWQIAYPLKFGERWCKELRRRAVTQIAVSIYGEKAIHE